MTHPATTRLVVTFLYPGVQALDVTGPADVLAQANAHRPGAYELRFAGARRRVVTSSGLELRSDGAVPASLPRGATALIPGAAAHAVVDLLADDDAVRSVRHLLHAADRIASVCSGAFVLARCGLLAGRRATTHWAGWQLLRDAEPTVELERDRLVVVDGHIWTSGGVASGIDLALAMVEADLGADVALAVSRDIVVPLRRTGQAAYMAGSTPTTDTSHTSPVLQAIRAAGARRLSVPELAARVAMSERTLHRHCLDQFGTSPGRLIVEASLDRARASLVASDAPLKRIARDSGFSDESALSRAFSRTYGMSPSAFRERFRATGPSAPDQPLARRSPAGSDQPLARRSPAGSDQPLARRSPAGSDQPLARRSPAGSDQPLARRSPASPLRRR